MAAPAWAGRNGGGGDLSRGEWRSAALGDLGVVAVDGRKENDDVVIHGIPPRLSRDALLYYLDDNI